MTLPLKAPLQIPAHNKKALFCKFLRCITQLGVSFEDLYRYLQIKLHKLAKTINQTIFFGLFFASLVMTFEF
jgi:hypothetical protein